MLREEFLVPLELTQSELAERMGVPVGRVNQILQEKRAVTADTAMRLSRVLGMSAEFWLGLQTDWELWHAPRSRYPELPAAGRVPLARELRRSGT